MERHNTLQLRIIEEYEAQPEDEQVPKALAGLLMLARDEESYQEVLRYAIARELEDWKTTTLEELQPMQRNLVMLALENAAINVAAECERNKELLLEGPLLTARFKRALNEVISEANRSEELGK